MLEVDLWPPHTVAHTYTHKYMCACVRTPQFKRQPTQTSLQLLQSRAAGPACLHSFPESSLPCRLGPFNSHSLALEAFHKLSHFKPFSSWQLVGRGCHNSEFHVSTGCPGQQHKSGRVLVFWARGNGSPARFPTVS